MPTPTIKVHWSNAGAMDGQRCDGATRTLMGSRRALLVAVRTMAGLGLGAAWFPGATTARRKRKKATKAKPNAYGCPDVGKPCAGDDSKCCSGRCDGSKPKKGKQDSSRCVAHDASICTASLNVCTTGNENFCNPDNLSCHCTITTGNAGFRGDFSLGALNLCRDCSRDTDCQEEFGPGAACVDFAGICATFCPATGGTACLPACA